MIRFSTATWWAIVDHAERDAALPDGGREACGLLAAYADRPDVITTHCPLANLAEHPRLRYEFDDATLLATVQGLEDMVPPRRYRGIYHSHLDATTELSATDIRYAVDPELLHLVVGVNRIYRDAGSRGVVVGAGLWQVVDGVAERVRFTL